MRITLCVLFWCTLVAAPKPDNSLVNTDQEFYGHDGHTNCNIDLLGSSTVEHVEAEDNMDQELYSNENCNIDLLGSSTVEHLHGIAEDNNMNEDPVAISPIKAILSVSSDPYAFTDDDDFEMETFTPRMQSLMKYKTSTPRKSNGDHISHPAIRFEDLQQQHVDLLGSSLQDAEKDNMEDAIQLSADISFNNNKELKLYQRKKKKTDHLRLKSSILQKAISASSISLEPGKVCKSNCLNELTSDFIRDVRYRFWTKNYQQRVEWFSDKYLDTIVRKEKLYFVITKGTLVCGKCFRTLYHMNKNFYYKWIPKFEEGAISSGYRKGRSVSYYLENAIVWLEDYGKYRGDFMPDRKVTLLPYKTRKIDVFKCYEEEMKKDWKVSIGKSSFYSMWSEKFDSLKIKKTNSFSRCQTCTMLTRRLEASREAADREEVKALIRGHNNRQMAERAYYRSKRKQAEDNKRQYLSLIIDGMDQAKTNLPHFTGRKAKGLDNAHLLPTHVQGIINHGLRRFTTFVDINEYPHDPNMIMNTLLREFYDTSKLMGNYLPNILYLQADNCFRENKNRYIMAFAELLVRKEIFQEVHLSFLIVGHTHEDIDAEFAKVAEKLRKKDAETIVQFMNLLPNSKQSTGLYDIKTWLAPHIAKFSGQSGPLHFKFSLDESNNILCEYKGLHHRPWKKMSKPVLKTIPTGIPKILMPSFHKYKFDMLLKNIEKCKYLFSDVVSDTQYRWWNRFISYLKTVDTNPAKSNNYARTNARWYLPLLPRVSQNTPALPCLPREIHEMVDREIDDPMMITESPKKKRSKKSNEKVNKQQGNQQKKGPQGKKRRRTIMVSYVYCVLYQKKQMFHCITTLLLEILLFLNTSIYYVHYMMCSLAILQLLEAYNLALNSHFSWMAFVDIPSFLLLDLNTVCYIFEIMSK